MFIRFTRTMAEPGQIREFLHCDFISDLEAKLEIRRHLRGESLKKFLTRERVICGINTDCFENLGVFTETCPLEAGLGDLAPILVTRGRVELPKPALIFPRRRADEHPLGGEFRRLFFRPLTVKGHVKGCRRFGTKSTCCGSLPKRRSPFGPFAKNFRARRPIGLIRPTARRYP